MESKEETELDFYYFGKEMITSILSKHCPNGHILKWTAHNLCSVNFILEQKSLFEDNEERRARLIDVFSKLAGSQKAEFL